MLLVILPTRDTRFKINHAPSLGIAIRYVSSWDFSKTNQLRGEVMGTARAADTLRCTYHSTQIQVNKQGTLGENGHGIPVGHTLILSDTTLTHRSPAYQHECMKAVTAHETFRCARHF